MDTSNSRFGNRRNGAEPARSRPPGLCWARRFSQPFWNALSGHGQYNGLLSYVKRSPGFADDFSTDSAAEEQVLRVSFQPKGEPLPAGYLPDGGDVFGERFGDVKYGWSCDLRRDVHRRAVDKDPLVDGLAMMDEHAQCADTRWEARMESARFHVFEMRTLH